MEFFIATRSKELPNWKCLGLAEIIPVRTDSKDEEATLGHFLLPDELIAVFESTLGMDVPVIFETIKDLKSRLEEVFVTTKDIDLSDVGGSIGKSGRPDLNSSFVAPASATEITLTGLMQDFFGIDGLGIEDDFFELGGDSLMAMTFLTRVKNTLNVHITIKFFFENPTVKGISAKIDEFRSLKEVKKRSSKKII